MEQSRKTKRRDEDDMESSESLEDFNDNNIMLAVGRDFIQECIVVWLDKHGAELLVHCFDEARKPSKSQKSGSIKK